VQLPLLEGKQKETIMGVTHQTDDERGPLFFLLCVRGHTSCLGPRSVPETSPFRER